MNSSKKIWLVGGLSVVTIIGGASGAAAAPGQGRHHEEAKHPAFHATASTDSSEEHEGDGPGRKLGHVRGLGHHFSHGVGHRNHDHAPVGEAPVVEEPVVEEPVVEEPVVEEPGDDVPPVEEPVVEEPGDDVPPVEEPVVEEPGDEEPVGEELVGEEPVGEELVGEDPGDDAPVEEPVVAEPAPTVPPVDEVTLDADAGTIWLQLVRATLSAPLLEGATDSVTDWLQSVMDAAAIDPASLDIAEATDSVLLEQ